MMSSRNAAGLIRLVDQSLSADMAVLSTAGPNERVAHKSDQGHECAGGPLIRAQLLSAGLIEGFAGPILARRPVLRRLSKVTDVQSAADSY